MRGAQNTLQCQVRPSGILHYEDKNLNIDLSKDCPFRAILFAITMWSLQIYQKTGPLGGWGS